MAAVALAAAAAPLLAPISTLDVTHGGNGRLLWRVPVTNGTRIDLAYTNSLYNAPTTERFVIAGRLLRLEEISSTREAVLEYLALAPPYESRNGRLVSKRPGPSFAELTIRIGQTGQQRLVIEDQEVPLYRVGAGEAVRVRVSRAPRVMTLLRRRGRPGSN